MSDPVLYAKIIGFVGITGSGKTYTMRQCLKATNKRYPALRHFIWEGGSAYGQFTEWEVKGGKVRFGQSLPPSKTLIYPAGQADQVLQKFYDVPFHVFRGVTHQELAQLAIRCGGVNLWLDEIDSMTENFKWKMPPEFSRLANEGRHIRGQFGRGVSVLWALRSLQDMNLRLLKNTRRLYMHRCLLENDIKALERWAGVDCNKVRSLRVPEDPFLVIEQGQISQDKGFVIDGLSQPQPRRKSLVSWFSALFGG